MSVELRVNAINAFITGCKSDGTWDAIKACCILAGWNNINGALIPLKGAAPTNFNFVSVDYDRATGLIGDASTKYLNSNRNNDADPQDNQHCSVYMSTAPTTGVSLICAGTTAAGATTILSVGSRSRNSTVALYSSVATSGVVASSRDSSDSYTQRFNGTTATITQSSQTPVSVNYLLHARIETNNSTVVLYTDARIAFYSVGESLDLAQLDARVTTLINAYGAI